MIKKMLETKSARLSFATFATFLITFLIFITIRVTYNNFITSMFGAAIGLVFMAFFVKKIVAWIMKGK
jgi:hypothetical protein